MSEKTCTGSILFGDACGKCSKWRKEKENIESSFKELIRKQKAGQIKPLTQNPIAQPVSSGWRCPNCGRGNAPFKSSCDCVPLPTPTVNFRGDV